MTETTLRILHLDDNVDDATLVRMALLKAGLPCDIEVATCREQYLQWLRDEAFDVILSDLNVPGYDGISAWNAARRYAPATPFILVTGSPVPRDFGRIPQAASIPWVSKNELTRLPHLVRSLHAHAQCGALAPSPISNAERLIGAVQELSLARDLSTVMCVVRRSARELSGAAGATFVLRENDLCYYADEDAISPLWKGNRFPMEQCISGWVMLNRQLAVIPDIYADPRIPAEAYRPTFVKSMAMVPIRSSSPVGAIGVYWAERYEPTAEELRLLQALADSTSVALENIQLLEQLERRVRERTAQLQEANAELEAFSYSVSHDLRAPLRSILSFSRMLQESETIKADETDADYLGRIERAAQRMNQLIDDLLRLASVSKTSLQHESVNISELADDIICELRSEDSTRDVRVTVEPDLVAEGDAKLLRILLENLLSNAWKYSSKREDAAIRVGRYVQAHGRAVFFVEDNGAGFDMAFVDNLFGPFKRLHSQAEFPGTGIGLATAQRIVHKHGGQIWAKSSKGEGATFYFTLGVADEGAPYLVYPAASSGL